LAFRYGSASDRFRFRCLFNVQSQERAAMDQPNLNHSAPLFYDFVDHALAELSPREALLVRAMRIWAKGAMARVCPVRLVAPRFMLAGSAAMLMPFHAFMLTLGCSAARPIGLSSQEEGPVSEDEAIILTAFGAIRSRNVLQGRVAFASIARADAIVSLGHKATLLVGACAQSAGENAAVRSWSKKS
jgi:hypothetical protein